MQTTSTSSLRADLENGKLGVKPGLGLSDLALKFEVKEFEFFDVEYVEQGTDLLYHFWPKGDTPWFLPGRDPSVFGLALERAFRSLLPERADVRADYTSPQESLFLLRFGENPDSEAKPRETYYVRVVGWANNPMVDRFLKQEVFERLDREVKDAT